MVSCVERSVLFLRILINVLVLYLMKTQTQQHVKKTTKDYFDYNGFIYVEDTFSEKVDILIQT